MECTGREDAVAYSITARRHCSLSSTGRLVAFGVLVAVSLAISIGFALVGAWPILPFAGLEMLILYFAFSYMERHAKDFERITILGDRLMVEKANVNQISRYEFNRYWAQIALRCNAAGSHCRLTLRSHGREVEFGSYLSDAERLAVAQQIKKELARP